MSAKVTNDVSWFDKNLEDFDMIEEEDLAEVQERAVVKKSVCKMKHQHSGETGGVVYPEDLWFEISRFIYPEDVGRFALVCKGTHSVVKRVHFWKTLHRRFYREDAKLPEHLQSSSLERFHGLRARVIQMLNHLYAPLAMRLQTSVPFEDQPHSLVGQRCILTWHKKVMNVWKFISSLLKVIEFI